MTKAVSQFISPGFRLLIAGMLALGIAAPAWSQPNVKPSSPAPCCSVTAVNPATHTATAREQSSGRSFQFTVPNAAQFAMLKIGKPIWANFATKQVSFDGKTNVGTILNVSAPAAPAPAGPHSPAPQALPTQKVNAGPAKPIDMTIPAVSFGAQQPAPPAGPKGTPLRFKPPVSVNGNITSIRGVEGVKQASNLPQGARDFLLLHARSVPLTEVNHYLVNVPMAEQWFRDHPEPEAIKQAAAKSHPKRDGHKGCHTISTHCAEESAKHAEDEARRQGEKLIQEAQGEWKHATLEVGHDWRIAEKDLLNCFADHTLRVTGIPVRFPLSPTFTVPLVDISQTNKNPNGSTSTGLQGSVTFGLPVNADFTVEVDFFYIPCLPFLVRPKQIVADGNLKVGSVLGVALTATGSFNESVPLLPPTNGTSGTVFPVAMVPIVIAGVPVGYLNIDLFVDGRIKLDGAGRVKATAKMTTTETASLKFKADGHGAELEQHTIPGCPEHACPPERTVEQITVDGRLRVKPEVYVALQLALDTDALVARAGTEPYLLGELYGCSQTTATQGIGAAGTLQEVHGLFVDLDWGAYIRAEAFAANVKLGDKEWKLAQRHIYFKDLLNGSTSLTPNLAGPAQPTAGHPASYKLRMPACYPYPDPLHYRVRTGAQPGAATQTASVAGASTCSVQGAEGQCWGDPHKETPVSLTWPSAGDYTLNVVSVEDKHGRKFESAPSNSQQVKVQQGASPPPH